MSNSFLCCDVFTVPAGRGFQFQIELQNEVGEYLASTESPSGVDLKTRSAWATSSAQLLAKEVGEEGKSIRFSLKAMPDRFHVPEIELGNFESLSDRDLLTLAREMAGLGCQAGSHHNHVLENAYAKALSALSDDAIRRAAEYYDLLQSSYGPLNTLCKAANAEAWKDLLELVRLLDSDRARKLTRMLAEMLADSRRGRSIGENRSIAIWNLAGELDYFDIPAMLQGMQHKAAA